MKKQTCRCPICHTEEELTRALQNPTSDSSFRGLANCFPALSRFSCALDLIHQLHQPDLNANQLESVDRILQSLIRGYAENLGTDLLPSVLVLVFVPALHKMYREISVGLENVSGEDLAQQLLADFFQVLRFPGIQASRSHISVRVVRTLRTKILRWALKDDARVADLEPLEDVPQEAPELAVSETFHSAVLLQDFLRRCCSTEKLSNEDYEFLLKLKLEGFRAKEIVGANGENHSAAAVHCRLQRIMNQLRNAANE